MRAIEASDLELGSAFYLPPAHRDGLRHRLIFGCSLWFGNDGKELLYFVSKGIRAVAKLETTEPCITPTI